MDNAKIAALIKSQDFEIPTEYEQEKVKNKRKLVRNEFETVGKYDMPFIRNQDIDVKKIDLWCYTRAKNNDTANQNKTIHFFTYDWLFNEIYDNPEKVTQKLKQYYAVLTPDFSVYTDMPIAVQVYNTFKNRWCGAYLQRLGLKVIPTVEWGNEDSFEFCFEGIETGSTVAIATYHRDNKEAFLKGYTKMLEVINPRQIICYGEKISGMDGNITFINPFDYQELKNKMGETEFLKKYMTGELYPSR